MTFCLHFARTFQVSDFCEDLVKISKDFNQKHTRFQGVSSPLSLASETVQPTSAQIGSGYNAALMYMLHERYVCVECSTKKRHERPVAITSKKGYGGDPWVLQKRQRMVLCECHIRGGVAVCCYFGETGRVWCLSRKACVNCQ